MAKQGIQKCFYFVFFYYLAFWNSHPFEASVLDIKQTTTCPNDDNELSQVNIRFRKIPKTLFRDLAVYCKTIKKTQKI